MYWLNVDIPTTKCTLHRDGCSWKPRVEPEYKGFGRMKRDGGWKRIRMIVSRYYMYADDADRLS